ncbi:MAG: hypothetical protein HRT87_12085, partial [Legionellales bacterium]|nr:hypothetical protein [Legionellales bacterium]
MVNIKKTLALCLSIKLASVAPIFASYYPGVEELHEGFHHAKKENNYHLYMSRISEETLLFWQKYKKRQDDWFNLEDWMTDSQKELVDDPNNDIRKSSFFG